MGKGLEFKDSEYQRVRPVSNDNKGVYHGLKMLCEGKVAKSNFDFEKYNKKCIQQYYELIDSSKLSVV